MSKPSSKPPIAQLAAAFCLFQLTAGITQGAVSVYLNTFDSAGFNNSFGDGTIVRSFDATGGVGGSGAAILDFDFTGITDGWYAAAGQVWINGLGDDLRAAGATSLNDITISFDIWASSANAMRLEVYDHGNGAWWFQNTDIQSANTFETISLSLADYTSIHSSPDITTASQIDLNFYFSVAPEDGGWTTEAHEVRIDNLRFSVASAPIPEPATYALISGIACLGFIFYRHRKAHL